MNDPNSNKNIIIALTRIGDLLEKQAEKLDYISSLLEDNSTQEIESQLEMINQNLVSLLSSNWTSMQSGEALFQVCPLRAAA